MLDRYVGWVETYRETHLAFVRGAAGGDPWVAEVYEETRGPAGRRRARARSACRTTRCAGSWCWPGSPSPRTWSVSGRRDPTTMTRAELLGLLRDVLDRLVRPPPARKLAAAAGAPQPAREVGARSADSSGGGCSFAMTSGALAPVASIDFFTVAP